ncbi:hypothetical protein VNO77_12554 [Canavalia gladiata]|uniref:Uncharacterized protein n=1 Tax=Canavalia gladiata TaxID=3824 RepID=A0AAN9LXH3_CANGL
MFERKETAVEIHETVFPFCENQEEILILNRSFAMQKRDLSNLVGKNDGKGEKAVHIHMNLKISVPSYM